jgi:hypothetical protein
MEIQNDQFATLIQKYQLILSLLEILNEDAKHGNSQVNFELLQSSITALTKHAEEFAAYIQTFKLGSKNEISGESIGLAVGSK